MYKILFIILFLLFSNLILAQNYIDLAKINYSITPQNKFDSSNVSTDIQELNADLTVPLVINDKFVFLTGLAYETLSTSLNPNRNKESVSGITLKLGTNIKHNEKWGGTYMLLPKISSDLKNVASQDFQLGGVVLMKYTKTKNINYKIGVYANNELFGPFIVPIFGFYYLSPSEKFEAKVLIPLSADLNYSFTKSSRFGINFKGQIRSYNLNSAFGTESDRYLAKATNDVYSYIQYEMKSGINFQLGFGRSLGRSLRVYDEKVSLAFPLASIGDNRNQLNTDFADGWLFKVGIFYRLKIKDKE